MRLGLLDAQDRVGNLTIFQLSVDAQLKQREIEDVQGTEARRRQSSPASAIEEEPQPT